MKRIINPLNIIIIIISFIFSFYILNKIFDNKEYFNEQFEIQSNIILNFPDNNFNIKINSYKNKLNIISEICGGVALLDLKKLNYFFDLKNNYIELYSKSLKNYFIPTSSISIRESQDLNNPININIFFDKKIKPGDFDKHKNEILNHFNKFNLMIKNEYDTKIFNLSEDFNYRNFIVKNDAGLFDILHYNFGLETIDEFVKNYELVFSFLKSQKKHIEKNIIKTNFEKIIDDNYFGNLSINSIIILSLIFGIFSLFLFRSIIDVFKK